MASPWAGRHQEEERNLAFMNIDFVFKIAAIGIIVAVLNQLLIRSGREEQAMMIDAGRADCGIDDDYQPDQRAV